MPEKAEVAVVPAGEPPMSLNKKIALRKVDRMMKEAGYMKLNGGRIRARAGVGRFLAQEGEHHVARSSVAATMADLEDLKLLCEEELAKAKESGDKDAIKTWLSESLAVLRQMNLCAKELNMTRERANGDDGAGTIKVPTMPARTVITNNTQIVVQQHKKD